MGGLFKSIGLKLRKDKIIKSKRPGDFLTYKEFALKNVEELTITGPICNKDIARIGHLIKEYKKLKSIDLGLASDFFEIPDNLFHGCNSLEKIILPQATQRVGESAFEACINLQNVILPEKLQTISKSAFYGCSNLKSIHIPQGVKHIGGWAFVCENLTDISVSSENKNFKSIDGILYTADGKTLVKYPANKKMDSLKIKDGVTNILDAAFLNCTDINEVSFPSTITVIGDNAFMHSSLETLNLPNGLNHIGKMAFAQCQQLTKIFIPGSVKFIGERAFAECHKLNSVNLCDGVSGIEDNIFINCHSLKNVYLPQSAMEVRND